MSLQLTTEMTPIIGQQDDYFSAGDWLYWMCEFKKAEEHFRTVLKHPSLSASDSARCYKSLGAVEVELKKYDDAINTYNKQLDALHKCDPSNTKENIISCYISIGKVYWLKKDYDQAIVYHQRALEFAQSSMLPTSGISTIHKNLANIYTNTKQFDLAQEHFQRALDIDRQHLREDHLQFGQTYANMGKMYQLKQDYKEALTYFEKARETWLKTLKSTHPSIEKVEKVIHKVKSKLTQRDTSPTVSPIAGSAPNPISSIGSSPNTQPVNPLDILTPNNIMIIWLDEHIGRDENCRDLKNEFRQITNSFRTVDSVDSCRQCLLHVKNRKVFFIIQGKHAKEIVPDIVKIISPEMKPVVYIFCLHMEYLNEWAQEQNCNMEGGMFDHEKDLLDRLTNDVKNYVKQKSVENNKPLSPELVSKFLTKFTQMYEDCRREQVAASACVAGNNRIQTGGITAH